MTPMNPDPNRHSAGGMSDDSGNGTAKQKMKEDVRDAKHEVGAKVSEKAEAGQQRLAGEANALSDAIDAAASNLDDHDREGLARYARELSNNLSNAAGKLEGRNVNELANDAKRLARNNPALFMLGSVAVGFGLSRFFKASAERDHHADDHAHGTDAFRTDAFRNGDSSRNDGVSAGTLVTRHERDITEAYAPSTAPLGGGGREMP